MSAAVREHVVSRLVTELEGAERFCDALLSGCVEKWEAEEFAANHGGTLRDLSAALLRIEASL